MASSPWSPPLAASQGVGPPPAASQGRLVSQVAAEHFNEFTVATYNVGASQDVAFQSGSKMEGFKQKLRVSSKGETGGRACIHHPKGLPRPGPSVGRGPAPPGVTLRAVGT